ncbi:hypothetical protein EV426DRAFT_572425 [Tirmania nivea]|nr:hypothetical protein EV426DRAFT_572425 [Tirmania nivea]
MGKDTNRAMPWKKPWSGYKWKKEPRENRTGNGNGEETIDHRVGAGERVDQERTTSCVGEKKKLDFMWRSNWRMKERWRSLTERGSAKERGKQVSRPQEEVGCGEGRREKKGEGLRRAKTNECGGGGSGGGLRESQTGMVRGDTYITAGVSNNILGEEAQKGLLGNEEDKRVKFNERPGNGANWDVSGGTPDEEWYNGMEANKTMEEESGTQPQRLTVRDFVDQIHKDPYAFINEEPESQPTPKNEAKLARQSVKRASGASLLVTVGSGAAILPELEAAMGSEDACSYLEVGKYKEPKQESSKHESDKRESSEPRPTKANTTKPVLTNPGSNLFAAQDIVPQVTKPPHKGVGRSGIYPSTPSELESAPAASCAIPVPEVSTADQQLGESGNEGVQRYSLADGAVLTNDFTQEGSDEELDGRQSLEVLTEIGSRVSHPVAKSTVIPLPGLDPRSPSVLSRHSPQDTSPRSTYRGIVTVSPTQQLPEREVELSKVEENNWMDSLIKLNAEGDPVGDRKMSGQEARLVVAGKQQLEARLKIAERRYWVVPGGDDIYKRTVKIQLFGLRLERHAFDCQRCWGGWVGDSRQGCRWWSSLALESKIFNEGVWGPASQARNLLGIFGLNVEDHRKSCDYCSIGPKFELRLTCPWWRTICIERPDDVNLESLVEIGRSETQKALDDQFILLGDLHHSICICFQKPWTTMSALLDCPWWHDIQRLKREQEEEEKRVLVKPKLDVIQISGTEEAAELDPEAELTELMGEEIYDVVFAEKVREHARRCKWCLKGGLLWIRENCPTWRQLVELKPENFTRDMLIRLTSSAADRPMDDPRKGASARLNFLRRVEYHSKTCTKCYKDGKFKVVAWCSDWNKVLGHKPDDVCNFDALTLAYIAAGYTQDDNVFQDGCLGLDYFLDGSEDEDQSIREHAEYAEGGHVQMSQTLSNALAECNPEPVTSVFKLFICNPDPEPAEGLSEPVDGLQTHGKSRQVCLAGGHKDNNCRWWDIQEGTVAAAEVARNWGVSSMSPVPINEGSSSRSEMPLNTNVSEVPMQEDSRPKSEVPINRNISNVLMPRLNCEDSARNIDSIREVSIKDNDSLNSKSHTIESVSSGSDGGVPLKEVPAWKSEVQIDRRTDLANNVTANANVISAPMGENAGSSRGVPRHGNISGLPKNSTIHPNRQGKHDYIFPWSWDSKCNSLVTNELSQHRYSKKPEAQEAG